MRKNRAVAWLVVIGVAAILVGSSSWHASEEDGLGVAERWTGFVVVVAMVVAMTCLVYLSKLAQWSSRTQGLVASFSSVVLAGSLPSLATSVVRAVWGLDLVASGIREAMLRSMGWAFVVVVSVLLIRARLLESDE